MSDTANNTKNRTPLNILKVVCFLLAFCAVFFFVQNLLIAKVESKDYRVNAQTSYWSELHSLDKDTVDVLYIGSSIAYCGVDPMYIYNETGSTGYVLASGSARYDSCYLALREALDTQSPKVLMLEASAFRYQGDTDEAKYHRAVDSIDLDYEKLAVTSENSWEEGVDLLGFAFPLFRYHNRWDSLTEDDWRYMAEGTPYTVQRGHAPTYKHTVATRTYNKEDWEPSERNCKYMDKIYDLCEENDIQLIVFKVPSINWSSRESTALQEWCDGKGVAFYDYTLDMEEIGIDRNTDFYDEIGHLNQYGCEKFMDYFIDDLYTSLNLPDHRNDESNWNEDYQEYLKVKKSWKKHAKEVEEEE